MDGRIAAFAAAIKARYAQGGLDCHWTATLPIEQLHTGGVGCICRKMADKYCTVGTGTQCRDALVTL